MAKTVKRGFTLNTVKDYSTGKVFRGVHYSRPGYAPLSGLCPTNKTAIKATLKAS